MPTALPNPRARSYRDLIVWQKSIALVGQCFDVARALPLDERFELGKQLRRSSVSIPANIAEGAGRRHRGDYARFLAIARGSQAEVTTYLDIIERLGYAPVERIEPAYALATEVGKMLSTMLRLHNPNPQPLTPNP